MGVQLHRGSVLTAVLLHASVNRCGQLWKVMPEYSAEPASAAEAASATAHMNLMVALVIGVAAIAVVLVYGPRSLTRRPGEVLGALGAGPGGPSRAR